MRGDHEEIAAQRMMNRRSKNSGTGQQAQIANQPEEHAKKQPVGWLFFYCHRRIQRTGRSAITKVCNERSRIPLAGTQMPGYARFTRKLHRDFTRRKSVALLSREPTMEHYHKDSHGAGGHDSTDNTEDEVAHVFCIVRKLKVGLLVLYNHRTFSSKNGHVLFIRYSSWIIE